MDEENLQFSINGVDYQSENVFLDLAFGDYIIFLRNENNCISSVSVQIADSSNLSIRKMESFPALCNQSNGGFSVDLDDGREVAEIFINIML